MALSEAALGKIRLAESENRPIPPNWATDAQGRPTTDPTAALAGLLLPTGGPKGYGLALIVDVLTGVLSGGAFAGEVKGLYADTSIPNDCAHFCLAIDPAVFGSPDTFRHRTKVLAASVRASQLAPGADAVLLPGQREAENASRARREGVTLPDTVLLALIRTAALVDAHIPEALVPLGKKGRQ
jgi:LDH2 family malate/lactate/ureidoglycolate dehydrogenase